MKQPNIKHCTIGDIEFDVATNRQIVSAAFEECPEAWAMMMDINKDSKRIKKIIGNEQLSEDIDADLILKFSRFAEVQEDFVRHIFHNMLEAAKSPLYDFNSYEDMANDYLEYADDVGVLYDYVDGETDEASVGLVTMLFEFAVSVFTTGKQTTKPKVKLAMTNK